MENTVLFCVTVYRGFVLLDFRVSSVLNRDVKQYGKKYLFDCNEETCWNSDQVKHPAFYIPLYFAQSCIGANLPFKRKNYTRVISSRSYQGERQWVIVEFPQSVKVSELKMQFQGGFTARTCGLQGKMLNSSS